MVDLLNELTDQTTGADIPFIKSLLERRFIPLDEGIRSDVPVAPQQNVPQGTNDTQTQ